MEQLRAIADSSSLIVLARQSALGLLERVLDKVAIIPEVENETVTEGQARGYADARQIALAIQEGYLVRIAPTNAEMRVAKALAARSSALSDTDCLILACARERKLTLIMEEQRGRNMAVAEGIDYVTIQVLPLHGYIKQQLSFDECNDLLGRIGKAMRTDASVRAVLHAAAREIRRLREQSGDK